METYIPTHLFSISHTTMFYFCFIGILHSCLIVWKLGSVPGIPVFCVQDGNLRLYAAQQIKVYHPPAFIIEMYFLLDVFQLTYSYSSCMPSTLFSKLNLSTQVSHIEEEQSDSVRLEEARQKERESYQRSVLKKQAMRSQLYSQDPEQDSATGGGLQHIFQVSNSNLSQSSYNSMRKSTSSVSESGGDIRSSYKDVGMGHHSSYTYGEAPIAQSKKSGLFVLPALMMGQLSARSDTESGKREGTVSPTGNSPNKSYRDRAQEMLHGEDESFDNGAFTPTFRTVAVSEKVSAKHNQRFLPGHVKVVPVDTAAMNQMGEKTSTSAS